MSASITPSETLLPYPPKHTAPLRAIKKKTPLHLYLREQSFYFRFRIPKEYRCRCSFAEIRFSLQTDSLKEAKRKAALVTAALHSLFQEKAVVSPDDMAKMKKFLHDQFPDHFAHKVVEYPPTVHALHAWLNGNRYDYTLKEVANPLYMQFAGLPLPEFISEHLPAFLTGSPKASITHSDIKKRIAGYFRYFLECDSQDAASRTQLEKRDFKDSFFGMQNPGEMGIAAGSLYASFIVQNKANIDTPPLLCLSALNHLEKFVAVKLFEKEEISRENYMQIVNEYCKLSLQYVEILLARLKKDYSKEHHFFALPYEVYPKETDLSEFLSVNPTSCELTPVKSKNLSAFIDNYLETKVADGKKDLRLIPELRKHLELFIKVVSDKPIDDYERKDFRYFRDVLFKLPPNMTKRKDLRDKTLQGILAMSHAVTMQEKTINTYLVDVSALFNWLVTEGYLKENLATKLTIKKKTAEIDSKEPFTLGDLQTVFKSKELELYKTSGTPSVYWVPWISLYTGMRVEEICQLHCSDIYQVDGLWVIDINVKQDGSEQPRKKVKTDNSLRIIPIHSHLHELGLLEYHAKMSAKGDRLFAELKPSGIRMQYGKKISKDFSPFVRKLGVTGNKTFHSLRHTFSDFFKKRLLHNAIFEQVFGHAHETLASRRYGSRFTPQECYDELISKLDYRL